LERGRREAGERKRVERGLERLVARGREKEIEWREGGRRI